MKSIFLSFFFLSCSHQLMDISLLKKNKVKKVFTYTKKKATLSKVHKHRWSVLLFISNDYSMEKPYSEFDLLCPESDYLSNLKLSMDWWTIPIIYTDIQFDYQANCHD